MLLSTSIANKIFRDYEKAAAAKDKDAMFHVAVCYSTGFGVAKDKKKALEWCVKATEAGSQEAAFNLAENYEIGGIPVDATIAFTLYRKAAEAAHPRATWKVVCCYFLGYGVEKNLDECRRWKAIYNTREQTSPTSEAKVNVAETSLHRAARQGNIEAVKYMLGQRKYSINAKDNGRTPLHYAAENGHIDLVELLIREHGADVKVEDGGGRTAMNLAVREGHLEIIAVLAGEIRTCTKLNLKGASEFTVKCVL